MLAPKVQWKPKDTESPLSHSMALSEDIPSHLQVTLDKMTKFKVLCTATDTPSASILEAGFLYCLSHHLAVWALIVPSLILRLLICDWKELIPYFRGIC